ncbi:Quinate/shikimate 5-dehydrogenase/glutamyl-tRNA reductase [Penicillium sp. IBT 16267x]|nr:Quinate/shikimate 5-dehydrogenase/glutamyl-tRNA reductase [Penicillium sp. IBT 16267x]
MVVIIGTIPDFEPQSQEERFVRSTIDRALVQSQKGVVVDMCYSPSVRTYLYALAEREGWKVASGVEVVVLVCLAQQILWIERAPDKRGIDKVLAALGQIH